MKNFFTLCLTNEHSASDEQTVKTYVFGPREETLGFLRQFARVYQAEPALEERICSYIIN
ncbi:MAG: hypothetical protein LBR49_03385 [Tannerella sp.]|jgi:hypothetical protein|nr:hypothetical protein [Tannerella sp.]